MDTQSNNSRSGSDIPSTSKSSNIHPGSNYSPGHSQSHQLAPGAPQNQPRSTAQPLFLAGVPARKFGAEPIYSTYPIPPFVSPEKLGAPPMSPTTPAFGQSPTSMIDARGSFGEQMDTMLAMRTDTPEDAQTKRLWEQYDARATALNRDQGRKFEHVDGSALEREKRNP